MLWERFHFFGRLISANDLKISLDVFEIGNTYIFCSFQRNHRLTFWCRRHHFHAVMSENLRYSPIEQIMNFPHFCGRMVINIYGCDSTLTTWEIKFLSLNKADISTQQRLKFIHQVLYDFEKSQAKQKVSEEPGYLLVPIWNPFEEVWVATPENANDNKCHEIYRSI